MPFALNNTRAIYQRLTNKIFHKQIGKTMEVACQKQKEEESSSRCKKTFETLREYQMKLNYKNYEF